MLKKFSNILTLLMVLLIAPNYGVIAGDFHSIGSRSIGMGRSSVAISDFWSSMNNQAGIALFDKPAVGIFYENKFFLNELSTKSIAGIIPVNFGVFAINYTHFGYTQYSEQKIGLAYARSFSKYFRIGLQLDYLITTLGNNYGSTGNITFELGIQSDLSENFTLGAWVYNPIMTQLSDYDNEKIPATFKFGLLWNTSKSFLTTIEAEKTTSIAPIIIRGGLEYNIHDNYFFRSGFSTYQEIFSFGLGFKIKHIKFDLSTIMHESLGFSLQGSMIFKF